jgi:hypothetical protein
MTPVFAVHERSFRRKQSLVHVVLQAVTATPEHAACPVVEPTSVSAASASTPNITLERVECLVVVMTTLLLCHDRHDALVASLEVLVRERAW